MVIFTAVGTAVLGTAFGGAVFGALGITSALAVGLATTVVLGAALRALTPKPSFPNRGYDTTALGSALDHQIIYGKMRVSGARIYDEATGTDNKFLHRIIAVAGHEVESFDRIYINDEYIDVADLDSDGNVPLVYSSDGLDTSDRYNGKIRINLHLGSPTQAADADLVAESQHWTSAHKLSGIAYMYIRLKFDADAFPNGIPEINATVNGKKVYDPRTSTTAWSDNPALCVRDYLTSSYGIAEATANIDDTLVIAAANVCDQFVGSPATKIYAGGVYKIKTVGNTDFTQVGAANNNVGTVFTATGVAVGTGVVETARYTCNGAFTTASTPYDMINNLLTSMDGSLWYSQGKWRIKPAYWTAPVLDLNEDDLRSSVSLSTRHSRRSNFNTVKGTFRGEESNWQTTDYPQVPENTPSNVNPYLAVDNGQESVADVDLPFTDNSVEARRIARISLERNRQQLTVSASFGLKTLQVQVGDNIRLTNSRFGWDNKEFEVVAWSFGLTDGLDLQTNMTLRETAESVYDEVDDGVVYERDNTTLLSPFLVPNPSLNATVVRTFMNEDGTAVPEIEFSWSVGNTAIVDHYEFEWKFSSATEYSSTTQLGTTFTLSPAISGASYDFRVRAVNVFGVASSYVSGPAVVTGNDATIPNAPTEVTVTGGYAASTVAWTAPTTNTDASALKDLFQYEVFRGTSSNPTVSVGLVASESFTDGGLADNTTYYYRVKAVDFTGNSSSFSGNGNGTTNPQLVDGASVLIVYADDASGSNQSLTAGSREYVQYYEYVTTAPTLPVSGTFVKYVGGAGSDGNSIFPIYADSSAGSNQSFDPSGKTFVTFYESTTTPSLPVSGQTFVEYVGTDGTNGLNSATVFLYNKSPSATPPSLFSGTFTYTFSTGVLSGGTLNGWTQEPPSLSQGDNLFVSLATASSRTATDSIPTAEFSTPEITGVAGVDGVDGGNGYSTATVSLFRKTSSDTAPSDPSGTFTYTFSTSVLSGGTLNGWSQTAPSIGKGEYLWVIQASAYSNTSTDTIAASEFSGATITGVGGVDGGTGPNGDSARTVYLFRNGTTEPPTPSTSATGGFNTSGEAVAINNWTTDASIPPAESVIYVASRNIKQVNSTGNWVQDGSWQVNPAAASGSNGATGGPGPSGSDAPRFAEIALYFAGTSAPSAPSATITWSTGAISSITSGWSRAAPTKTATSDIDVYSSYLVFIDTTPPFSSTVATGSTPAQSLNFDGLVTFTGGDFAVDGSTITSIDGGNITTGTINAEKIDVDGTITLAGATSGFIAGRTSQSDFGADGFYIGRTSTSGTSADGFQLSHTSVTGSSHPQLSSGTVQAVIHEDSAGLRIYEPVFYQRGDGTGGDILLTSSGNVTLTKGDIHTVTIQGSGGGGGGGGSQGGGSIRNAVTGTAGAATSTVLTGASGFTGTRTHSASGGAVGAGGANTLPTTGGASVFGGGGIGGFGVGGNGSSPASDAYGAGGGGGAGYDSSIGDDPAGYSGGGGGAGETLTITFDLTSATTDGTFTVTIGAAGGTTSGQGSGGTGAAGRGGAVSVSGILDGYAPLSLADLTSAVSVVETGSISGAKIVSLTVGQTALWWGTNGRDPDGINGTFSGGGAVGPVTSIQNVTMSIISQNSNPRTAGGAYVILG